MKTLFKLVVLAVLALAVVGGWKDWYTVSTSKSEDGRRQFTLVLNDPKMMSDLAVVKANSRDAVDHALSDEADHPDAAHAAKPDPKVHDLQVKRLELSNQLEQLKKVPGAKIDAALRVIQQKIDDYDRQIEKALAGH